jgi:hypothetical protein
VRLAAQCTYAPSDAASARRRRTPTAIGSMRLPEVAGGLAVMAIARFHGDAYGARSAHDVARSTDAVTPFQEAYTETMSRDELLKLTHLVSCAG